MTFSRSLIRRARAGWLAVFVTCLLTPASPCLAQSPARSDLHLRVSKRKIVIVRSPALARRFPERKKAIVEYPVISGLADAVVLRRIRSLLRFKNIFDYSLQEYRQDQWLTEFTYEVNHNGNGLFDITFTESGEAAYPDSQSKHFAIDLRTGRTIKAADVFRRSEFSALAMLVNQKLQIETAALSKSAYDSSNLGEGEGKSIAEALGEMKFKISNLDDFSISEKGVTFLYDAGFPHAIEAFEPEGHYLFSYAELKPFLRKDGLLWQFVH